MGPKIKCFKGRAPYTSNAAPSTPVERGVGKGDSYCFARWTLARKSAEDYILWVFKIDVILFHILPKSQSSTATGLRVRTPAEPESDVSRYIQITFATKQEIKPVTWLNHAYIMFCDRAITEQPLIPLHLPRTYSNAIISNIALRECRTPYKGAETEASTKSFCATVDWTLSSSVNPFKSSKIPSFLFFLSFFVVFNFSPMTVIHFHLIAFLFFHVACYLHISKLWS